MYSGGLNLSYLNGSNSLNQFNPATAVKASNNQVTNTFEKTFEKSIVNKARNAVKNEKLNNEKTFQLKETSSDTSIRRPKPIRVDGEANQKAETKEATGEVQMTEEVENALNEVKKALNESDIKKVKSLLESLSEEMGIEIPVEDILLMMESESFAQINDLLDFIDFMFDGDVEMATTEIVEKLTTEIKELISEMIEVVSSNDIMTEESQNEFHEQLTAIMKGMDQVKPEVIKEVLKEVDLKAIAKSVEVEKSNAKGILEKLSIDQKTSQETKHQTPFEAKIKEVRVDTAASSKGEGGKGDSEGLKLGQTDKPLGQELKAQMDETGMKPIEIFKDQNTLVNSVKASDNTTVLQKSVFDQVLQATKMNFNVTENGSEMIVKLKPQELGQVELKVSIEKGVLMAEMTVENETVKAALESNMADLKSALSQKGYDVEGLNVSVGHQDKEGAEDQYQGQKSRRVRSVDGIEEEIFDTHMTMDETGDSKINYLG